MGVLEPEAGQEHLRVAVGPVVAVPVGVEQQIRRLADEDAAVTNGQPGSQVQAVDEDLRLVGPAVAVGIFEDLDPVGASRAARRRVGHPVVLGAKILVDGDRLQPRRIGILQVLDDPEPAALVEAGRKRLPHHRLGREDLDVEPSAARPSAAQPLPAGSRRARHRVPAAARRTSTRHANPIPDRPAGLLMAVVSAMSEHRIQSKLNNVVTK